jgi:hypothetical protein
LCKIDFFAVLPKNNETFLRVNALYMSGIFLFPWDGSRPDQKKNNWP